MFFQKNFQKPKFYRDRETDYSTVDRETDYSTVDRETDYSTVDRGPETLMFNPNIFSTWCKPLIIKTI